MSTDLINLETMAEKNIVIFLLQLEELSPGYIDKKLFKAMGEGEQESIKTFFNIIENVKPGDNLKKFWEIYLDKYKINEEIAKNIVTNKVLYKFPYIYNSAKDLINNEFFKKVEEKTFNKKEYNKNKEVILSIYLMNMNCTDEAYTIIKENISKFDSYVKELKYQEIGKFSEILSKVNDLPQKVNEKNIIFSKLKKEDELEEEIESYNRVRVWKLGNDNKYTSYYNKGYINNWLKDNINILNESELKLALIKTMVLSEYKIKDSFKVYVKKLGLKSDDNMLGNVASSLILKNKDIKEVKEYLYKMKDSFYSKDNLLSVFLDNPTDLSVGMNFILSYNLPNINPASLENFRNINAKVACYKDEIITDFLDRKCYNNNFVISTLLNKALRGSLYDKAVLGQYLKNEKGISKLSEDERIDTVVEFLLKRNDISYNSKDRSHIRNFLVFSNPEIMYSQLDPSYADKITESIIKRDNEFDYAFLMLMYIKGFVKKSYLEDIIPHVHENLKIVKDYSNNLLEYSNIKKDNNLKDNIALFIDDRLTQAQYQMLEQILYSSSEQKTMNSMISKEEYKEPVKSKSLKF
jgi:hypothetical protein